MAVPMNLYCQPLLQRCQRFLFGVRLARVEFSCTAAGKSPVAERSSLRVGVRTLGHRPSRRTHATRSTQSINIFSTKRGYHKQLFQHTAGVWDKEYVLQFIQQNVVYNADGILAINKPAGLPVSGKVGSDEDEGGQLAISCIMSDICDITNTQAAEIAQAVEKEASGLVLFGENKMAAKEITTKMLEARKKQEFTRVYQAIVCGIPEPNEGAIKLNLGNEIIEGKQMTVVRQSPSHRSIKAGEVHRTETQYRVLSANEELQCALLELKPKRMTRHQLQVHLVLKLCPALGDHIYSPQVQTILGVPMLMDPDKLPLQQSQVLKTPIRKALSLTNRQVSRLPLFIHWHQAVLPEWRGRHDLQITAPLPAHFRRTLRLLGLEDPRDEVPPKDR